jgi:hypothetical protein
VFHIGKNAILSPLHEVFEKQRERKICTNIAGSYAKNSGEGKAPTSAPAALTKFSAFLGTIDSLKNCAIRVATWEALEKNRNHF